MLTQETKSKFGSVVRGPRNVRVLVLILPADVVRRESLTMKRKRHKMKLQIIVIVITP